MSVLESLVSAIVMTSQKRKFGYGGVSVASYSHPTRSDVFEDEKPSLITHRSLQLKLKNRRKDTPLYYGYTSLNFNNNKAPFLKICLEIMFRASILTFPKRLRFYV